MYKRQGEASRSPPKRTERWVGATPDTLPDSDGRSSNPSLTHPHNHAPKHSHTTPHSAPQHPFAHREGAPSYHSPNLSSSDVCLVRLPKAKGPRPTCAAPLNCLRSRSKPREAPGCPRHHQGRGSKQRAGLHGAHAPLARAVYCSPSPENEDARQPLLDLNMGHTLLTKLDCLIKPIPNLRGPAVVRGNNAKSFLISQWASPRPQVPAAPRQKEPIRPSLTPRTSSHRI